jgi:DNA-binding winged helix-turn-helix (wHTH) protein
MMPPPTTPRLICFEAFEVDLKAREVYKDGARIKLQQQPFQVLAMLLEQAGDIVTRDELRRRLWPEHTFVDFDQGLNKAIKKIREALGDSAQAPRFIETLPKRGYRFIALGKEHSQTLGAKLSVARRNLLPQGSLHPQASVEDYEFPRRAFGFAAGALFAWLARFLGLLRRFPL